VARPREGFADRVPVIDQEHERARDRRGRDLSAARAVMLRRGRERQREHELAATPELRLEGDLTSHRSRQLPADGQSEADALSGGPRGEEGLEDAGLDLRRDPLAVVVDADFDAALGAAGADADAVAVLALDRARLGGVQQQVEQDLGDAAAATR